MATCFVYKWTHKSTLMWYIGSRTARGCHPDDGYICSSKIVKPMIEANPNEWERTIISIGNRKEMCELENEILYLFDAQHDPRSFNKTNGYGLYKNETPWNKGKKGTQIAWNRGKSGEQHHNYGKTYNIVKKQKHSEEFKKKKQDYMFENNPMHRQLNCPHCTYIGPKCRWHWDNCKNKENI